MLPEDPVNVRQFDGHSVSSFPHCIALISFCRESAQLNAEIEAAESELKPFVRHFGRSAVLPQGPTVFYANLRTLEGTFFCSTSLSIARLCCRSNGVH